MGDTDSWRHWHRYSCNFIFSLRIFSGIAVSDRVGSGDASAPSRAEDFTKTAMAIPCGRRGTYGACRFARIVFPGLSDFSDGIGAGALCQSLTQR